MTRLVAAAFAAAALLLQPASVDTLVARMTDVKAAHGFRVQVAIATTPRGGPTTTRQLRILGRRTTAGSWTSYEQIWPAEAGGRAVVTVSRGPRELNGFVYRHGAATPLTSAMQADAFFDSDVTLEDVAERYWNWPDRKKTAEAEIGAYHCVVADLRPPGGTPTTYGFVRAWLAPELALALRLEAYGRDGRLIKRIELFRPMKIRDRWVGTIVTVERADGRSRTVVEGSTHTPDDTLAPADFGVAAVRRRLAAGGL